MESIFTVVPSLWEWITASPTDVLNCRCVCQGWKNDMPEQVMWKGILAAKWKIIATIFRECNDNLFVPRQLMEDLKEGTVLSQELEICSSGQYTYVCRETVPFWRELEANGLLNEGLAYQTFRRNGYFRHRLQGNWSFFRARPVQYVYNKIREANGDDSMQAFNSRFLVSSPGFSRRLGQAFANDYGYDWVTGDKARIRINNGTCYAVQLCDLIESADDYCIFRRRFPGGEYSTS
jgi:hypothetical protein